MTTGASTYEELIARIEARRRARRARRRAEGTEDIFATLAAQMPTETPSAAPTPAGVPEPEAIVRPEVPSYGEKIAERLQPLAKIAPNIPLPAPLFKLPTLFKGMELYEKAVKPVQLPVAKGYLALEKARTGKEPAGYKAVQEASAFSPSAIEAAFKQTDMPPGVMGGIELLADPLNLALGVGFEARVGARAAKAGKQAISAIPRLIAPDSIPSVREFLRMPTLATDLGAAQYQGATGGIKPLRAFIGAVNPSAVADDPISLSSLAYRRGLQWGDTKWSLMEARLRDTATRAFKIDTQGRVINAVPRAGTGANPTPLFPDFMQQNSKYVLSSDQQQFVMMWRDINDFMVQARKLEGVPIRELGFVEGDTYFTRLVTEIKQATARPGIGRRVGVKAPTDRPRRLEMAEDGARWGVDYSRDPVAPIEVYWKGGLRTILDKRVARVINELPGIRTAKAPLQLRLQLAGAKAGRDAALKYQQIVNAARKGASVGEGTIARLEGAIPGIGLRNVLKYPLPNVSQLISRLTDEMLVGLKISPAIFRQRLADMLPSLGSRPLTRTTVYQVLRSLGADSRTTARMLRQIFKEAAEFPRRERQALLKELGVEASDRLRLARENLKLVQRQHSKALEAARRARPGEAFIQHPAFAGKIYPQAIADEVSKFFGDEPGRILNLVSRTSGTMVSLGTTVDFGWPMIQGLVLLVRNPLRWAKIVASQPLMLAQPGMWGRYISSPERWAAAQKLSDYGVLFEGTAEMVEETARRGFLQLIPRWTGMPWIFERFGRAFSASANIARLEMGMALEPLALKKGGTATKELADFVNTATGTMSSLNLGLSPRQQAWERLILFAPRFTKATLGLAASTLRGDLRGDLARQSLARLAYGGTMFYVGLGFLIDQQPNLDPRNSKFMTYQLWGRNVGVGGAILGLVRLLANSYAAAADDPSAFVRIDGGKDNPFLRWFRGRVSPVGSMAWDTVSGRDFVGNSTELGSNPLEWGKWALDTVGSRLMPFWLEARLYDNPNPGAGGIAEFGGLRTFPISLWELRNDLRDKYAEESVGKTWENLTVEEQIKIAQAHPDLAEATQKAREFALERADVLDVFINDRQQEVIEAKERLMDKLDKAQAEFEQYGITGAGQRENVRKKIDDALAFYREEWERIEGNAKYRPVTEFFAKLDVEKKRAFGDVAYADYLATVVAEPSLVDQFDNYNFDKRQELDQAFRLKWGDDVWNYIQNRLTASRADRPPLVQQLEAGRRNPDWRAYWEVDQVLLGLYGTPEFLDSYRRYKRMDSYQQAEVQIAYPLFKQMQSAETKARQRMREKNRSLDAFLFRFGYTSTVRHAENIGREEMILSFG